MVTFCGVLVMAAYLLPLPFVAGHSGNESSERAKGRLLVQLFGLTPDRLPVPSPTSSQPEYMTWLFLQLSDENGWVTHPDAIPGNHVHGFLGTGKDDQSVSFDLSHTIRDNERILHVDLVLRFKVYSSSYKFPKPVLVVVEIIDRSNGFVVSKQLAPSNNIGWRKFAIGRRVMENWLQSAYHHVELMVRVRKAAGDAGVATRYPYNLSISWEEESGTQGKGPILVVYRNDPSLGAKPSRSTTQREPNQQNLQRFDRKARRSAKDVCRRREMTVDFAKLGWESFVVAPPFYAAYRCVGQCSAPIGGQSRPTPHAILQSNMAAMPGSDVKDPCCVPIKLSGISLLYYDVKNRVSLKLMSNMVVQECGCR